MTPTELFKAGRLAEAVEAQVLEVKAKPADQGRRLFLFELLAFSGELDRARRQLDALRYEEPELTLAAEGYRRLLDSEVARRKFFDEGVSPEFLGEPPAHLALRVDAVNHLRLGRTDDFARLVHEANNSTPAAPGKLNGKPFAACRDADDLFAGVLEVMAQGKYFWVALESVVSVAAGPPRFPRDVLYFPARLELASEAGEVFLPVLYPGSHRSDDEQARLGRVTDWREVGDAVLGVGARVFLFDDDAHPLTEWREFLRDEPEPAAGESPTPDGAE